MNEVRTTQGNDQARVAARDYYERCEWKTECRHCHVMALAGVVLLLVVATLDLFVLFGR
jgi:hypothetical protein